MDWVKKAIHFIVEKGFIKIWTQSHGGESFGLSFGESFRRSFGLSFGGSFKGSFGGWWIVLEAPPNGVVETTASDPYRGGIPFDNL